MLAKTCATCSKPFEAKRNNATYCSNRCSMVAYRARKATPTRPANRPAIVATTVPSAPTVAPSFEPGALVAAVLAEAALCESPAAVQQALSLARTVEDPMTPAHALAALHRQLAAARAEVLATTPRPDEADDIVDVLKRRRSLRRAIADEVRGGRLSEREAVIKFEGVLAALAND